MPSSSPHGDSSYRSVLSRQNPDIIDEWNGSNAIVTSGKAAFDGVTFDGREDCTIQEWTDFTYEAINLAYGDLLDRVPSNDRRVHTPTVTPTRIRDEDGIDVLSQVWTCNIVRAPLKYAGAVLRRRPPVCAEKEYSEIDPVLGPVNWAYPELAQTKLERYWAVYDGKVEDMNYTAAPKDHKKHLAFAIGDSKLCQGWKSAWIQESLAEGYINTKPSTTSVHAERLRPLERLATYCRLAGTRYGFILTQSELVAFRVRRLDSTLVSTTPPVLHNRSYAGIEYKSVPWHASGPGKLTANLAIWALGCMGMNDQHRSMEAAGGRPLDSMARLTKWAHDERTGVYRNDISGREITEESWEELGDAVAFVRLGGKEGGASYTSTFTAWERSL